MAADSTAIALYKLAMESQQYVAAAQAAMQANQGLAASAAPVAAGEEKIDKALRGGEAALDRKIARFDAASRINAKYAKELSDLAKIEEAGIGSPEKRAQALALVTAAHQKELEALNRIKKANAENAAALGTENAALQVAAAAGDRYAQALLTMDAKQQQLNKDLQAGKIGLTEHVRLINLTQEVYRSSTGSIAAQEAAMRKSGTATGLARYELINLSRQFQDIGVSLAGGQSPLRILIEQGSQIADIFASSTASIRQFFGQAISWAGRFLISGAGVVTIIASLGLAAAAAAISWLSAQKDIERSLIGIGAKSGATVADVNRIAEAASKTTRLSASGASEAAIEFIKTGKIYTATLQQAVNLTDKFALAIGENATGGAKKLAEILSDPVKGMETLNERFGGLDAKTREYVISLVIAKNEQEAMRVIMATFEKDIKKAAEATSIWARGWMTFTEALSGAWNKLGAGVVELIGERIQKAILVLTTAATALGGGLSAAADAAASAWKAFTGVLSGAVEVMGEALRADEEMRKRPRRDVNPGRVAAGGLPADPAAALGLKALNEQMVQLEERAKRATEEEDAFAASLRDGNEAADGMAKRLAQYSLEADAVTRAIFPQIDQLKKLEDQYTTLKRALDNVNVKQLMSGEQVSNAQAALQAVQMLKMAQEDSLTTTIRQNAATLEVVEKYRLMHGLVNATTGEQERLTLETSKQLNALDKQIAVYTARGRAGVEAAVNEQKLNELVMQGKSAYEAQLIITRQQTLTHLQNMTALKEQLNVAQARTGIAKINAEYENNINQRLREGATLEQATAEAAIRRRIAIEQVNTAVEEQIHALNQSTDLIRAQAQGWGEVAKAAQAYENAIRAGADETHASALEAAVLANELERAAAAASRTGANIMGMAVSGATWGTGGGKVGGIPIWGYGPGMLTPFRPDRDVGARGGGSTPPPSPLTPSSPALTIEFARMAAQLAKEMGAPEPEAWTNYQNMLKQAAESQQQAAVDLQSAAKAQEEAAKAAREARITALDEAVADIVATKLLAGQSAQAVNMLIEGGAIQFGTASTRFQTQLDLYKRAGASNSQTAAAIRAGIIGEGAKPSELLAALDSLTDSVDANTAAQIGLSDFYTQQGDRLVGYRGMNVQTGIRSSVGASAPGGVSGAGGVAGGMGGVVNQPGVLGDPVFSSAPTIYSRILGTFGTTDRRIEKGYYQNGQWVSISIEPYQQQYVGLPQQVSSLAEGGIMGASGLLPLRSYQQGGIASRPQMAIFGEAGPEAFVPLKGGAIPVKLMGRAANDDKPTTVVNINAPLINFTAEPTRDEVRESAFQAAQMLRRVAAG